MSRSIIKSPMGALVALASLFGAFSTAQAAVVTYNYTILGDVIIGDETFTNAWNLTAGDVISATGTFTADLGTIGSETGTVVFALGDTMLIDLLGGQYLTHANDIGGLSLSFSGGALTDFSFLSSSPDFNSNFTSFDDFSLLYGEWQTNATLAVVPLPAAAWLFGAGLMGLGAIGRRRVQTS